MNWPQLTKSELLARQAEIDNAKPTSNKPVGVYFNRTPDTVLQKCKNAHKESFAHCCDYYARTGFATCQGCADNVRGDS